MAAQAPCLQSELAEPPWPCPDIQRAPKFLIPEQFAGLASDGTSDLFFNQF